MGLPTRPGSRAPKKWTLKDLWAVWLGAFLVGLGSVMLAYHLAAAAIAGLVSAAASAGLTNLATPVAARLALAAVFAGLVAIVCVVSYFRGARPFAFGLAGGYAVLTLSSTGDCTLFLEHSEGELRGIFYLAALVLAFVGLVIASLVRSIIRAGTRQ
jgi:hypothetical protein